MGIAPDGVAQRVGILVMAGVDERSSSKDRLAVHFEEKDIERDQAALVEMMQLAESKGVEVRGVPVVRVGAELVVGYNEARIKSLVDEIR